MLFHSCLKCLLTLVQIIHFVKHGKFNSNILHQLFDNTITFVIFTALKHKFKRDFCTQKLVLNVRFEDFRYDKFN